MPIVAFSQADSSASAGGGAEGEVCLHNAVDVVNVNEDNVYHETDNSTEHTVHVGGNFTERTVGSAGGVLTERFDVADNFTEHTVSVGDNSTEHTVRVGGNSTERTVGSAGGLLTERFVVAGEDTERANVGAGGNSTERAVGSAGGVLTERFDVAGKDTERVKGGAGVAGGARLRRFTERIVVADRCLKRVEVGEGIEETAGLADRSEAISEASISLIREMAKRIVYSIKASGLSLDVIGWNLDCETRTFSLSQRNEDRALFRYLSIHEDEPMSIAELETIASLASRYALVCREMKPCVGHLYAAFAGLSRGRFGGNKSVKVRLSEEAKHGIRRWRAFLCLQELDRFRARRPMLDMMPRQIAKESRL